MSLEIAKIKLHHLSMDLKHPFITSFGTIDKKEFYIVEVIDNDGRSGFGETVAFNIPWYTEETFQTTSHLLKDVLMPLIKKNQIHHPKDVTGIFQSVKRNHMAKAGLEGAVWDLFAKKKAQSLANVIGGIRNKIDAGVSLGIEENIDNLLQKIDTYTKQGYKRIKLKVKPDYDLEVLKQVRHHFPNVPLMADANSCYTLHDTDHLKKFDAFNLMMIEQPLADDDIMDHAQLQREINTPICLDESICSFQDARMAIALKSCQIINIKIGRVGGLMEAIKIHDLCKENNIHVWCGGMLEAGVGRAHNIALASLAQFTLPGDISASSRYFHKDIISPEVMVDQGVICIPEKPGIGYEVDRGLLDNYSLGCYEFIL